MKNLPTYEATKSAKQLPPVKHQQTREALPRELVKTL